LAASSGRKQLAMVLGAAVDVFNAVTAEIIWILPLAVFAASFRRNLA
jgi:hypothetical protein